MAATINSKQNSNRTSREFSRILRWPQVHNKVGLCRSHVHQLVSKGQFPAPIKLTPNGRASGWIEPEIDAWVEQRIEDSRINTPREQVQVTVCEAGV